jgi:LysM repeat protein
MRTLIAVTFLFFSMFSYAQAPSLVVEGTAPNLYISHTVAPKQSYYSVARMYNLTPAAIAGANGSNLQTGLKIGQTIKVPLTPQNFDQADKKEANETLVPVYHVVGKSETLFRIGNNYNKVPLASIKTWNNLPGDNLEVGKALIVGHLKIKNDQVSLLNTAAPAVQPAATPPQPATKAPEKEAVAVPPSTTIIEDKKPEAQPATAIVEEKKAVETPSERKIDTVAKLVEIAEKKPGAAVSKPVAETKPDLLAPTPATTPDEGFFGASYSVDIADKKLEEKNGNAGTFKSTSGWQNKKYYVLMNNVEPGTIVKISAADKIVYAKVLGSLPDMKENGSLLLRVSNAAASYLGKVDPTFPIQVSYHQ